MPLFVTHHQADRDSLGSAIGLQRLLGGGDIATPEGVGKDAASLAEAFGVGTVADPSLDQYDLVVVVDSPSTDRIAPITPDDPILIDHHVPGDLASQASDRLVDTEAGSTAELIAGLCDEDDRLEVNPDAALALLVGILDDTSCFQEGSSETVEAAGRLFVELGDRAGELPALIEDSTDKSKANARRLGVLRASGYRAGDIVVAVTHVGGDEGAAANELRDTGVDLSIVCSEQNGTLRVVGRASDQFVERVSLGADLLPSLAEEFGGNGGGHPGAGTAKLEGAEQAEVEPFVLDYLEKELGVTFAPVS